MAIDKDSIKSLLKKAYDAKNPKIKNKIRHDLYKQLLPLYLKLKAINVRQLHFQEKNNYSFLRMHRPGKYGDDLTNIRESVRLVNKHQKSVAGFEEGRIFNGYRYVYPLSYLLRA